ncbi:MAG: helix-turn-helix transcriptional regulator [Bacteroidetes bacterium]|nr:helix-turn-helix transcriptional regulator [Bacteroidota bacterium]MBU2585577.1 helix-turn-helix transcriptional regulator [Bacteroidota bacterium]
MSDVKELEKRLKKKIKNFDKKYNLAEAKLGAAIQIANEREKVGITQADLAKRLNTTQSVISRIESGKQNLSLDMLQKIAEALGKRKVSVEFK